jgi:ubiquitin carboxyl-terminal hydrolase 5/13
MLIVPVAPALPQFNEVAMAQLEGMGFPTVRCQKALLATGNADADAAMEWLFTHMEDPGMPLPCCEVELANLLLFITDIDSPIQLSASSAKGSSAPEPSAEQVSMLSDMGFTPAQARKALRETVSKFEDIYTC